MDFPHGESVDVLTAGTVTDPYSGESTPSWDTSTEVSFSGIAVEPRPSSEPVQDARNAVTSGYTLYGFPVGSVTAANRVRVRGVVYEVLGDPADWRSPFTGWAPGLVVQCGRTAG